MARKEFKDLNLSSAFLFAAALSDEEACRIVLEIILKRPISRVEIHSEYNILFSSDYRCVRLDIYASDELKVGYDLEMQNENENNLPKRSRYYQAEMDVTSLEPGDDVNKLPPTVIVFICTFDPFGKGLYQYTFEQRCLETEMPLGDETKRIFLSTKGKNSEDVSDVLVHFLKYVENSTDSYVEAAQDKVIDKLHDRVTRLKKSRELEGRFMHLEELIRREERKAREEGLSQGLSQGREEGRAQGLSQGRSQGLSEGLSEGRSQGRSQGLSQGRDCMLKLISCMVSDNRQEEIPKLSEDPQFCSQMLEEYHLQDDE